MPDAVSEFDPFVVSNDLRHNAPALGARMLEDGYLFFRGIGPKDTILQARGNIVGACQAAGWCDNRGNWTGAGPYTEGDKEYMQVYKQIIKLPSFLAIPAAPPFKEIIGMLVDGPVILHNLRIARITFPNNVAQTTAAHQDHWYIRGTPETYTVWTPLGDCPIALGGLAVLPGSHRHGFIEHSFNSEKKYAGHGLGDEQIPSRDRRWVAGDFAVGDFLVFHSLTIHKALPNQTPDRLRFSTDNRYQRQGDEIAEISKKTHYNL